MSNCSIWPIDRILSGATTPVQSDPGSDGHEGVLCIPQSSSIPGTSPLDRLFNIISGILVGEGDLTSYLRDAVCILES